MKIIINSCSRCFEILMRSLHKTTCILCTKKVIKSREGFTISIFYRYTYEQEKEPSYNLLFTTIQFKLNSYFNTYLVIASVTMSCSKSQPPLFSPKELALWSSIFFLSVGTWAQYKTLYSSF